MSTSWNGKPFAPPGRVIDPRQFHAAPGRHGTGLFSRVDLEPGDRWWLYDLQNANYVKGVVPWHDYDSMGADEKFKVQTLGFVDTFTDAVVLCAEPFCRVNHSFHDANSASDDDGHSMIVRPVPAGTEITISYAYETVQSLIWKFPEFGSQFEMGELQDRQLMMTCSAEHPAAIAFLKSLG